MSFLEQQHHSVVNEKKCPVSGRGRNSVLLGTLSSQPGNSTQLWALFFQRDVDKLATVQERAMGMISGLESMTYEERLKELGLFSLQQKSLRGT